jgi:hypothetical protein
LWHNHKDVANQNQPYSTATLYGGFDSAVTIAGNVQPGCELDARWPANYGDIYFHADDGCLYDSSSTHALYPKPLTDKHRASLLSHSLSRATLTLPISDSKIFDQCCTASTTTQVSNPYVKVAASCNRTPGFGFTHYEIYSNGWITDGGEALHNQVNGCTGVSVTLWEFGINESQQQDGSAANLGTYTSQYLATFNIDLLVKDGCIGRAIHSAGGPDGVVC